MRSSVRSLALLAILLSPLAHSQNVPYSFHRTMDSKGQDVSKCDPTSLQQDFEDVYNQIRQNKAQVSNLTVVGVVTSVNASAPLCSSGGLQPSISFCGSLAESQVSGLVSDLAGKVAKAGDTMTGQLTNTSSITVTGGGGLLATYGVKSASAAFGSGATVSTFSSSGSLSFDPGATLQVGFTGAGSPANTSLLTDGSINMAYYGHLALNGAGGYINVQSSVAATQFIGDGTLITGLSIACKNGTAGGSVQCNGDGTVNISTATGQNSFAGPGSNKASGQSSVAIGQASSATGLRSFAWGNSSTAKGSFLSWSAGHASSVTSNGAWNWADDNTDTYFDNGANSFNVRANGGVYFDSGTVNISTVGVNIYGLKISTGIKFLTTTTGITWADGSISTSASSGSSLTKAYTTISTAAVGGALSNFPAQSNLSYDSAYFVGKDSPTASATFISLATGTASTPWTRQIFLSGSGTYTTPANAIQIRVHMIAGGGGGGGSHLGGNAGNGNTTSFGAINVSSGIGGLVDAGVAQSGGAGGSGGVGASGVFSSSSTIRWPGQPGDGGQFLAQYAGANGGNSGCGAGGAQASQGTGAAGAANSGGGGAGGSNGGSGSGGGGGECADITINTPAASYSYYVGAGGTAGTGANPGGAGGSGVIVVDETYAAIAPQGLTGATGATGVTLNGGWTSASSGSPATVYLTTTTNSVGIGTTNPLAPLSIATSNGYGQVLITTGTYGAAGVNSVFIGIGKGDGAIITGAPNGSLDIAAHGIDLSANDGTASNLFINTSGNVGIGTTAPSQTLSVNGTVSLNTNSGTQLYYCAGGTLSQIVIRGSSGAEATSCTTGGGTVTAMGIYVP